MKELRFVDVGEGITEGEIHKWMVKDFDEVKEDQPLVQVETDKAIVNLPAPISGKIKIIVEKGSVKVGDILAFLGDEEELKNIPVQKAEKPVISEAANVRTEKPPNPKSMQDILATPAVRKLARDLGVDITKIAGTGPNGRIMESDIRNFAAKGSSKNIETPEAKTVQGGVERIPMTQIRKAIARNMELSWTIPRATHMDLIDATHLAEIVSKEKPKMEKLGVKLTYLPFMIKAAVEALKENERFNASYDKEKQEVIIKRYYNIGISAEGDDGLRVIVIKDADKKSIIEIAKEIQELKKKVMEKTIKIEEMSNTSFTITSVGSLGGGFLSIPMINYPDVAILAMHFIRDMPIAKDGNVVIRKILPFSIVFDHRVVDGAEAVRFGNSIKGYLEDPEFLEMI